MDFALRISIAMALIGFACGYVMYLSDFCLTGMVRDHILFGEKRLLRPLFLIVLVSAPVFWGLRLIGLVPDNIFDPPTLNCLIGGILFGFGMTLSGACVAGTFWKLGSGQGLQLATIFGLFAGSALFAETAAFFGELNKKTLFTNAPTLPELLGINAFYIIAPLLIAGTALLWWWSKRGLWRHRNFARSYIEPWKAGIVIIFLGTASLVITGMPLSVTTVFVKAAGFVESVFMPGHFGETSFFKSSQVIELPLQGGALNWGSGPVWDSAAAIQAPFLLFMALGGFAGAKGAGHFEWHFRVPFAQYLSALLGGVAMGMGSRAAGGCNIWHLLGGLPFFSISSFIFFIGLYPGAYLGVGILKGKILSREAAA
jgi:uncharacterized membrane protein YedE/YeeE